MSAMSPIEAAFVTEAMERLDAGAATVNMRDGHSEFWGADELAKKLESTDHKVEWVFKNTKMDVQHNFAENIDVVNLMKDGGANEAWDDGYLVTKANNVNGIGLGQAVDGCHIRFGVTADPEDTSAFEHGFFVGIYPDKKVVRGDRGQRETNMAKYEIHETLTVRILRGSATVFRNDEENPFDVVAHCEEEGTSMHGMIHIREKDAIGHLEGLFAVCMVTTLDVNGNLFSDSGVERLATALEVPFSKVVFLDLGLNRMRCPGAIRIAQVLEKSTSKITSLVLSNNEIDDEGVTRLAEALGKEGCKVTNLWLSGNQICDAGAVAIAETLEKETCQLTFIDVTWNRIEDEGMQRLMQGLANPECKVTEFALDHNRCIEKKTKKMLVSILAKVERFVDMVT